MQRTIRNHVKDKVLGGALPVMNFIPERAHEILALMLDPRYCKGQTFLQVHADSAAAKGLWKQYTEAILIPTTVTLATFMHGARQASCRDDAPTNNAETGLCDSDTEEDISYGSLEFTAKINVELRMFRKATDLPPFACKKTCPLKWWSRHATLYPSLAEVARIVLGVPGSQIECERIFSLAGLLTLQLRNRMSPENLASLVFLDKNVDADKALDNLLGPIHGDHQWSQAREGIGKQSEHAGNEQELFSSTEGGLNWYVMDALLEENELLIDEE